MHNAAIYTRQSKDKTGEEAGVGRQLKECLELAATLDDVKVIHRLSDNDISATTGKRRPDFEKLVKLIEAGEIDTVICWHPDRLYRKLRDLVPLMDLAVKHPINIVSVQTSDLDLNTPTGRMTAGILGSVASQEGEHRTARQKSSYKDSAASGAWGFSHRPFGYERTLDGRVVQVPAEAVVVAQAFEDYYGGKSHHAIVTDLNTRNPPVKTATGRSWSITQLREVLKNGRYAGINYYLGVEQAEPGNWEPIISRDLWEKYQGAATARKRTSTFSREATSLLSGILRCGVCGAKVYRVARANSNRHAYNCSAGVHVSAATTAIDKHVRDAVLDALLLGPSKPLDSHSGAQSLDAIATAVKGLQSRSDDLVALVGAGYSTMKKVTPQLDEIKVEIGKLEAQRESILATSASAAVLQGITRDVVKGGRASFERAAEIRDQIEENFDALPLGRQRELVKLLVEVKLNKGRGTDRVAIHHKVAESLNDEESIST
jgi:site-specific DNA recombinase